MQKGWFKEAGVEVEFLWFDYVPSMDAYVAGKVDGARSSPHRQHTNERTAAGALLENSGCHRCVTAELWASA